MGTIHETNGHVNGAYPPHLLGDAHEGPGLPAGRAWDDPPPPAAAALDATYLRAASSWTPDQTDGEPPSDESPPIKTYILGDLVRTYPHLREPVIHGLLRVGETMNVIASPKTGKSWLATGLAYAVATGREWLGYQTVAGDVLIIDNELHQETLASRLRRVAEADNIDLAEIAERVTIMPLRGRLTNLRDLGTYFKAQIPGRYRLVVIDAYYRTLPVGTDENDNGAVAGLYNLIDSYADHLRCAFTLIHHTSKGDQSQKRVTDVGSGAGSQSRAADSHLILRPHAEDDAVVLDAVVRSFPPIAPRCLRWKFPRFELAEGLDPADLRQTGRGRRTKAEASSDPQAPPEPTWDARRFADTFGTAEPKSRASILAAAADAGLSDRRAEQLLKAAIDRAYLQTWRDGGANTPAMIATKKPEKTPTRKRRACARAKKSSQVDSPSGDG